MAFDAGDGGWHQDPNQAEMHELLLSIPLDPIARGIAIVPGARPARSRAGRRP